MLEHTRDFNVLTGSCGKLDTPDKIHAQHLAKQGRGSFDLDPHLPAKIFALNYKVAGQTLSDLYDIRELEKVQFRRLSRAIGDILSGEIGKTDPEIKLRACEDASLAYQYAASGYRASPAVQEMLTKVPSRAHLDQALIAAGVPDHPLWLKLYSNLACKHGLWVHDPGFKNADQEAATTAKIVSSLRDTLAQGGIEAYRYLLESIRETILRVPVVTTRTSDGGVYRCISFEQSLEATLSTILRTNPLEQRKADQTKRMLFADILSEEQMLPFVLDLAESRKEVVIALSKAGTIKFFADSVPPQRFTHHAAEAFVRDAPALLADLDAYSIRPHKVAQFLEQLPIRTLPVVLKILSDNPALIKLYQPKIGWDAEKFAELLTEYSDVQIHSRSGTSCSISSLASQDLSQAQMLGLSKTFAQISTHISQSYCAELLSQVASAPFGYELADDAHNASKRGPAHVGMVVQAALLSRTLSEFRPTSRAITSLSLEAAERLASCEYSTLSGLSKACVGVARTTSEHVVSSRPAAKSSLRAALAAAGDPLALKLLECLELCGEKVEPSIRRVMQLPSAEKKYFLEQFSEFGTNSTFQAVLRDPVLARRYLQDLSIGKSFSQDDLERAAKLPNQYSAAWSLFPQHPKDRIAQATERITPLDEVQTALTDVKRILIAGGRISTEARGRIEDAFPHHKIIISDSYSDRGGANLAPQDGDLVVWMTSYCSHIPYLSLKSECASRGVPFRHFDKRNDGLLIAEIKTLLGA